MHQATYTNHPDVEFDNDDECTYQWMMEKGYTEEEASRILYNLQHYGSIHTPDDAEHDRSQQRDHYVHSEEFQRFLKWLDEMTATETDDSSVS